MRRKSSARGHGRAPTSGTSLPVESNDGDLIRTLDGHVAGGSGCYCIVAVQTYSGITAEVLDLAPVITVTREFLVSSGGTSV
jgi:hypothetical protein